jgi:soluble lytic murein transglycosylase-like protein
MATDYAPEIAAAARQYSLDPLLVEAVVIQESSGRTNAYRYEPGVWRWFQGNPKAKGLNKYRAAASYGLMQMLFATATDYGFATEPEFLFFPKVNLDLGCKHLAKLIRHFGGDIGKGLQAYNGGIGNVGKAQVKIYAQSVLGIHAQLVRDHAAR